MFNIKSVYFHQYFVCYYIIKNKKHEKKTFHSTFLSHICFVNTLLKQNNKDEEIFLL